MATSSNHLLMLNVYTQQMALKPEQPELSKSLLVCYHERQLSLAISQFWMHFIYLVLRLAFLYI